MSASSSSSTLPALPADIESQSRTSISVASATTPAQQFIFNAPVGSVANTGTILRIVVSRTSDSSPSASSSDGAEMSLGSGDGGDGDGGGAGINLNSTPSTPSTLPLTEPISRSNSVDDFEFVHQEARNAAAAAQRRSQRKSKDKGK